MKSKFRIELDKAKKNHYALGAFNFDSLEMAKAIVLAAEKLNAPVILMVTESSAKHMGLEYVFSIVDVIRKTSKVPVIIHWDHGFDLNLIKRAIDNNFDSVMLDASAKSFLENVSLTKQIVKYAHDRGVEVEAEIGHVGGKEDDRNSLNGGYTTLKEALEFVKLTEIDALAIAVGTSHGLYRDKVNLQFDLIKSVSEELDVPLVLHGSSGVDLKDLQKTIKLGISKINIGTDLKIAYSTGLKTWFQNNPDGFDVRKLNKFAINEVQKVVENKIIAFGSQNKA